MDSVCLPVEILESMKESSEDIDCHLYYCIKCFRLTEQVNPAYIEAFETEEREVDGRKLKTLSGVGKSRISFTAGGYGIASTERKRGCQFQLITGSF